MVFVRMVGGILLVLYTGVSVIYQYSGWVIVVE